MLAALTSLSASTRMSFAADAISTDANDTLEKERARRERPAMRRTDHLCLVVVSVAAAERLQLLLLLHA